MSTHDFYENPLITRYASKEMSKLWGSQHRISTWRKMWIALAEAEQELGLDITDEQLAEMRAQVDNIDFETAARHEKAKRHDVMAHVATFGEVCPAAEGKIHWGATSCFVTDNTDLLQIRDALEMIRQRLVAVIDALATFAAEYRSLPCLGFTHFQPAQPTTVGKRACLWAYDLVLDLESLDHLIDKLKARSTKGTTGTQASFLELFDGDHAKVRQLEQRVAEKMGFSASYAVTGQTYPRKVDSQIIDTLCGIAQSVHKAASDLRLLAHKREIEEPFEKHQIGSSAMPYKRNPMRSERMCGLARYLLSLQSSTSATMATQWLERTLDDSSNRRLVLPQAFLAADAILILYQNVSSGFVVYPTIIARNLNAELPYMATENVLMASVAAGGNRQELHEEIRKHALATSKVFKEEGRLENVLDRLEADDQFAEFDKAEAMDASRYVGRAPEQVDEFIAEVVDPIRERFGAVATEAEVHV